MKELGVRWGSLNLSTVRGGHEYVLQPQPILFGQSPGDLYNNPFSGGGMLKRFLPWAAELTALIQENKARILSEPSLVVLDGHEGNILVGGEIPIPVSQTNNGYGGAAITVDYKPYGVKLDVAPTIVADGVIQLTVSPEVSDLDYGNGVQYNGLTIPALGVRRATSTLEMQDGQTLVIGGLYSNTTSRQVERIPLLSQIPVLGEFFKNTRTVKEERELIILIQPEIVKPDTEGVQPPAPGSVENLPISKPNVGRHEFDQEFPNLNNLVKPDHEKPKTPVSLPPVPTSGAPGGVP